MDESLPKDSLVEDVLSCFASDGPVARDMPGFIVREGQLRMAQEIARTMQEGGALVVEAGTGIGKTYAYLAGALLSGKKVLLSTATKNLQDQLFQRDLPKLKSALGLKTRSSMLKGRSSYLCLQRLEGARQESESKKWLKEIAQIERWVHFTKSGDLSELMHVADRSELQSLVTSTRDNCLGSDCEKFSLCHLYRARREAMASDIVVINHHLFFADLNVRESGVAELLPSVHAVVFDEAHQLNDIGVQFMGKHLGSSQLRRFTSDMVRICIKQAAGLAPWREIAAAFEQAIASVQQLLPAKKAFSTRINWSGTSPADIDGADWSVAMQTLIRMTSTAEQALQSIEEMDADIRRLAERAAELRHLSQLFSLEVNENVVRWLETEDGFRMQEVPVDISLTMQGCINDVTATSKAWIFTSATLGHEQTLSWFTERSGMQGAKTLQIPSPFDYPNQATLYIPARFPKPSESMHSDAVAMLVAEGSKVIKGRTLVLTTSLRAMRHIAARLREEDLLGGSAIKVLLQGESSRQNLLNEFISDQNEGGYVLVASASFWEGVDIAGDALQLVVIDKLPFPPPDDPQVLAISRNLEAKGKNPFLDYSVTQAAVELKQGAGRLIRHENDRGILVICDVRLGSMHYRHRILDALPPMRRLKTAEEFAKALDELTRPSTTDS